MSGGMIMSRKRKYVRWLLLVVTCMMLLSGTMEAQAKNMKTATKGKKGVTWGIKVGKKYTYYSYWGGVGMIAQNVKITNWKDQWSGNGGMRMLTFRITFIRKKRPTASQLRKAATYYTVYHPNLSTSPGCYFTVVDYNDGLSLEDPNNPHGVIVSNSGWKQSSATTYKTSGYSISMTNVYVDVQIEYPYRYKGICIGVGGRTSYTTTSNDKLFWDGTFPFWMTDTLGFSSKYKVARFGRWWYG